MTQSEAKRRIVTALRDHLEGLTIPKQIELYDAMALTLPTKGEREKAAHMSWLLTEAQRHQLELFTDLCVEMDWPGHEHNGEVGT